MNSTRRTAVLVGVLFLAATATFVVSNLLITPILGSPDYLTAVARNSQLMVAAGLLALIDGLAVVGIAAALYPILKGQHPALAFGYAGMRIAELAVITVFVLSPLLLVGVTATAHNGADTPALGALLLSLRYWTLMVVYVFNGIAGLMLGYMLLRTVLVPRALSVLGLVGYATLLVAAVLDMLGLIDTRAGAGAIGLVPGGLFELVLPLWLFGKGFNTIARAETRLAR
jgi:hypothetical protein